MYYTVLVFHYLLLLLKAFIVNCLLVSLTILVMFYCYLEYVILLSFTQPKPTALFRPIISFFQGYNRFTSLTYSISHYVLLLFRIRDTYAGDRISHLAQVLGEKCGRGGWVRLFIVVLRD